MRLSCDDDLCENVKIGSLNGIRNYFLMGSVFDSHSIFFEPEVFFSKPGELPTKENGGVALLKAKKVTVKKVCEED